MTFHIQNKMLPKPSRLIVLFVSFLAVSVSLTNSFTLSTHKRWIVDSSTGKRVKLTCINWSAHLSPMLAEGLDRQPLKNIVAQIADNGFNCVRLTWATYMFTRHGNDTVGSAFDALMLQNEKAGLSKYNSFLLNMTHLQAFDAVVEELDAKGVMIILDNHVSEPKWCCGEEDGNGFFGDRSFDPHEWVQGLTLVSLRFKEKSHVVAVSLRNELRGPRQNTADWERYMSEGASAVHKANPQILVIVSGLNYDTQLGFLRDKPLKLNIGNKLVFEMHLYSWSGQPKEEWLAQPVNKICAKNIVGANDRGGFLFTGASQTPLLFSEFGYDMTGKRRGDGKFLTCILAYLAAHDLDWALWALQATYYLRKPLGQQETYGLLDSNWQKPKDSQFAQRFQLLQKMNQGPSTGNSSWSCIMYHPLNGHCIHGSMNKNELVASDCGTKSRWSLEKDGAPIRLVGTSLCLKATGEGKPVTLSDDCMNKMSTWRSVSRTKLHLATSDAQGNSLCLHKDTNSSEIVTRRCICVEDDDSSCLADPRSQWFQLVSTNVKH